MSWTCGCLSPSGDGALLAGVVAVIRGRHDDIVDVGVGSNSNEHENRDVIGVALTTAIHEIWVLQRTLERKWRSTHLFMKLGSNKHISAGTTSSLGNLKHICSQSSSSASENLNSIRS